MAPPPSVDGPNRILMAPSTPIVMALQTKDGPIDGPYIYYIYLNNKNGVIYLAFSNLFSLQ